MIKQLVVAKVHPRKHSTSTFGSFRTVELLDVDNNYKHYISYIDEENFNFSQWQKIIDDDYKNTAFVIKGEFKVKRKTTREGKPIINADARFNIVEKHDRYVLLDAINNWQMRNF